MPDGSRGEEVQGEGGAGEAEACDRRRRAGREASYLMLVEHTIACLKFASSRELLRRGLPVSPNKVTSQGLGRG